MRETNYSISLNPGAVLVSALAISMVIGSLANLIVSIKNRKIES